MKRNEQLFDIMGDIPDKYVEDAKNDNAITEKKTSVRRIVRTIAACAAVFTAVCAVPVAVIIMNSRTGNDSDVVPATTEITEVTTVKTTELTTAETTEDEPENTNKNKQITGLSFGTGPERPENYTPDRKYSYCTLKFDDSMRSTTPSAYNAYENKDGKQVYITDYVSGYLKEILVDEKIADSITNDMVSEALKYTELHLREYNSFDAYCRIDTQYNENVCLNGYLEVQIEYRLGINGDTKTFPVFFDLVEGRKLDKVSDLFYYGEDYVSLIGKDKFGDDFNSKDSSRLVFELNKVVDLYDHGMIVPFKQSWYDIYITGRYRDLSGIIKDEYIAEDLMKEWTYNYYTDITIDDDVTINTNYETSRFHSESEIDEFNNGKKEICGKAIAYFKDHHYLDDYEKGAALHIYFDSGTKTSAIRMGAYTLGYDNETGEILPPDRSIPEWRDYIKGYFETGYAVPDAHDYVGLKTEIDFDPEKYECHEWRWADDDSIEDDGNKVTIYSIDTFGKLSDEEIKNLGDLSFVLNVYNIETNDKKDLLVVMPWDKIYRQDLT